MCVCVSVCVFVWCHTHAYSNASALWKYMHMHMCMLVSMCQHMSTFKAQSESIWMTACSLCLAKGTERGSEMRMRGGKCGKGDGDGRGMYIYVMHPLSHIQERS